MTDEFECLKQIHYDAILHVISLLKSLNEATTAKQLIDIRHAFIALKYDIMFNIFKMLGRVAKDEILRLEANYICSSLQIDAHVNAINRQLAKTPFVAYKYN